jgi:hypothetical protein
LLLFFIFVASAVLLIRAESRDFAVLSALGEEGEEVFHQGEFGPGAGFPAEVERGHEIAELLAKHIHTAEALVYRDEVSKGTAQPPLIHKHVSLLQDIRQTCGSITKLASIALMLAIGANGTTCSASKTGSGMAAGCSAGGGLGGSTTGTTARVASGVGTGVAVAVVVGVGDGNAWTAALTLTTGLTRSRPGP